MSCTKSLVAVAKALEQAQDRAERRVELARARLKAAAEAAANAERELEAAEAGLSEVNGRVQAVLVAAAPPKANPPKVAAQVATPTANRIRQARAGAPSSSLHNTVTTEDGKVRELSMDAAARVKAVIGRRKEGLLEPLDGEEAQAVLTALDYGGHVGDVFTVTVGRRRVRFTVEECGLAFAEV
jgi:hypothetical protein